MTVQGKAENGKRILITGASGFIGGHIVREALERGWEVHAAVRSTSRKANLQDPRLHFFPMDFNEKERLRTDLRAVAEGSGGFHYVVHNAGVTKPKSPAEFRTGNADFTRDFAQMLSKTQTDLKKFVFMGSIAALGPGNPRSNTPIREDQQPQPLTPYGRSKLLAEQYLEAQEELPYIVLRPAAVYGPRDPKFIVRVMEMLRRGIELRLGPKEQALSFVHVSDLARVTLDACMSSVTREDFNISDGEYYNQQEFNALVKAALGARTVPVRIPSGALITMGYALFHILRLRGRPVHLSHYKMRELTARNWNISIGKARRLLGFQPQITLPEGITRTVQWYLERGDMSR